MRFREKLKAYKERLWSIGNHEPLTKFSFFLIILLDIFVFSMILTGIEENTRTITTPESYASYQCQELIKTISRPDKNESIMTVVSEIENFYSYDYSSYSSYGDVYGHNSIAGTADGCQTLQRLFREANSNSWVRAEIVALREIEKSIAGAETEKSTIQSSYDTMLLEKIANQKETGSLTPESADTAKQKIAWIDQKLSDFRSQKQSKIAYILAQAPIQNIYASVASYGPTTIETYKTLAFWYPIKTFGAEILFILPLLIITVLWSNASIRRNRGIQTLIASHLLGIIAIFILVKVLELIYDILPHALLEKILNFLESWNIIGLWYYLLIFLAIAGTMGLIYIVQKKLFSKERLQAKHADRGECIECGAKLHDWAHHCIRCGTSQTIECPSCSKTINTTSKFCMHCGKEMK